MGYLHIFIIFFFTLFLIGYYFRNQKGLPTNWPIIGMFPALFRNVHRINEYLVDVAEKSQLTFLFKGPWFTNMKVLVTFDPVNVHHVLSKSFGNYHMGAKFNEIFEEILGQGAFFVDSNSWMYHRKIIQSFLNNPRVHQRLVEIIWKKIEGGIIPILEHVCKQGLEIDLQILYQRFTFDVIFMLIMDKDPYSLTIDFPRDEFLEAVHDGEKTMLRRFAVPTCIWKFQRWLNVGLEKKYKEARQTLDASMSKFIAAKREEMSEFRRECNEDHETDLLGSYVNMSDVGEYSGEFIRDTIFFYLVAGKDTAGIALSWFFYLLSKNKHVLSKIKEELATTRVKDLKYYYDENNLIYLHASLCEVLRLYPPAVFEARAPIDPDTLPSGHRVDPNTQIIFNMYAMGRMKSIWGNDCYEFKPERWISEKGKIRHEPSYKFLTFNTGPKACPGKNMAFTQMKVLAAAIISNYDIQPVEGQQVVPDVSMFLHMKYGFKVNVFSRNK